MDLTLGVANRVKSADKKMINSSADVNQLVPFKYPWAWSMYLKSTENHWMPSETIIDSSIKYENFSTEDKVLLKTMLYWMVAQQAGDGYILDNSQNMLFMYRYCTAPEARQYLLRQGFEDAIAVHAYQWIVEAIGYNEANDGSSESPEYKIPSNDFSTDSEDGIIYYICFIIENVILDKGIYPLSTYMHSLKAFDKYPSIKEILTKVIRDRMNHVQFALKVINTIFEENPRISRDHPKINALLDSVQDTFIKYPYVVASIADYRAKLQPISHPYRGPRLESFNSGLDIPTIKQHLDEDNHVNEQPTSVSGLNWE